MANTHTNNNRIILLTVFFLAFTVVLIRNAWLSDDSYITYRTVDNFIHGYGLTWNTDERVQAYTHPLWMFLISTVYFFTHQMYYTAISLCIAVSLASVLLLATVLNKSTPSALFSIAVLLLSKAFMDYSTSGLENPLTHLLLISFFIIYTKTTNGVRRLFMLSFIASLAAFNRMDTFLLYLPPLLVAFWQLRSKRGLFIGALGFLPFIFWVLFSIFYYGFPFPNTAYAKALSTCISRRALVEQGFYYLFDSLSADPLTLFIISLGILIPFVTRKSGTVPFAAGILCYLIYIIGIGGDFMSGRFLSAPFLSAVGFLSFYYFTAPIPAVTALIVMSVIGFASPHPPLLITSNYDERTTNEKGIADEKGYYYQSSGLLKASREYHLPYHEWVQDGENLRKSNQSVFIEYNIGYIGFYAGPKVHIVDVMGLTDPLLARLPATGWPHIDSRKWALTGLVPDLLTVKSWRIGHFDKLIPEGYFCSLKKGENLIYDKNLALYYDKLSRIVKGKLWDMGRLIEIFKMNSGKYDYLIELYKQNKIKIPEINYAEINRRKTEGTPLSQDDIIFFSGAVQINLGEKYHKQHVEITTSSNQKYRIVYFDGDSRLDAQDIPVKNAADNTLVCNVITIPPEVVTQGYDTIKIKASTEGCDNEHALGHIRFYDS